MKGNATFTHLTCILNTRKRQYEKSKERIFYLVHTFKLYQFLETNQKIKIT